jgi:hypothetical protein
MFRGRLLSNIQHTLPLFERSMHTTIRALRREALHLIGRPWREPRFAQAALNSIPHQWGQHRSLAVAATSRRRSSKQTWRKTRSSADKAPVVVLESDAVVDDKENTYEDPEPLEDAAPRKVDAPDVDSEDFVFSWVPPAYRGIDLGAKKGVSGVNQGSETSSSKPKRLGRLRGSRTRSSNVRQAKAEKSDILVRILPDEAFYAKQEKEEVIDAAIEDLLVAASSYRKHFTPDTNDSDRDNGTSKQTPSKKLEAQVVSALKAIHPEELAEQKQVLDSESDFRSVCRSLQQICSTSCSLSSLWKYGDKDGIKYTNLAELTLTELVALNIERSHLRTKTSSSDTDGDKTIQEADKTKESVSGWFSDLIEGFVPSLASSSRSKIKSQDEVLETFVALDDSTLLSIQRLLKNVLASIAFTTQAPEQFENDETVPFVDPVKTEEDKALFEKVGRRMLHLLDSTALLVEVDGETVQLPMEMLCKAGTISSARLCNEIFQQYYSRTCQAPFPLVLEAYLESIKRESDQETLLDFVEEVMGLLVAQWNISLPTHRVERILQVSIVLNCMAEADMGKVKGMSESGDLLVKRALGGKLFTQFFQEVHSNNPKVDNQAIPIANALVHLYAGSGQKPLLTTAKKLLKYMMNEQEDTMLLAALYPTVGACNAVLSSLVQSSAEDESAVTSSQDNWNHAKKSTKSENFAFGKSVLNFMLSRSGAACFPNKNTYDLVFSLLEAADPKDIGLIGEEMLSSIEASNMLNGATNFSLPIHKYDSVLQFWLLTAKSKQKLFSSSGERVVPCRRAFSLLKKLEIRSSPWMLSKSALKEATVKTLYDPQLRPTRTTYLLVLQICAYTTELEHQKDASQVAEEVYQLMANRNMFSEECMDVLLESCPNRFVSDRVMKLYGAKVNNE